MTTPQESSKECELYGHVPQSYDVAFCHCKVCDVELHVYSEEDLKAHAHATRSALVEEIEGKCFMSHRGILRMKTVVIDGKQYYKNVTVDDIKALIEKNK